jgi:hypothetical protein
MEHPDYYRMREHLIEFLNVRAYTLKGQDPGRGHGAKSPAAAPSLVATAIAPAA